MTPLQQVPQEQALPQMEGILNEAAMAGVFQEALRRQASDCATRDHAELSVQDCKIEWIKYKPAINCTVCYRLVVQEPRQKIKAEQILYGRIYADGQARSRFVSAQSTSLVQPKLGKPMLHLPELDMLVWLFPNDRKLDGLANIVDARCLKDELLPEALTAMVGGGWRISAMTHRVVHYVPEHTCTVKVDLQLHHGGTGARKAFTIYGKTYYNDAGAETYRNMGQLWSRRKTSADALGLAQPLAYQPRAKLLWQANVQGETLLDVGLGSERFMNVLPQAAAAVAELHQSPVSCAHRVGVDDWLSKLQEMRRVLPEVMPSSKAVVQSLIDRLCAQAAQLGEQPLATLHGDLHLSNILVHDGKAALIDLDGLCHGPPLCDVGSFIAGMIYHGMLNHIAEPVMQRMIARFCGDYQRQVTWRITEESLHWYIAAALINERAFRCFSRLKIGRLDILPELVERAAQIAFMEGSLLRS